MIWGVMNVRVKICGITQPEDAVAAVDAGADALGFVFVPGTPRYVTTEQAAAVVRVLPPFVSKVGLFVDASLDEIRDTVRAVGLDTVQLHGAETPQFCAALQGVAVRLKAFRVRGPETLGDVYRYEGTAEAYLLDAYVPGVAGGTGATFDWELAVAARELGRPLILAGGLTPETAADAVRQVRPYAVDVSSGVERAPGRKDPDKVCRFVREVRRVAWGSGS